MPMTLHEAFVPTAVQILGGLRGLIGKAEAHCAETGCSPETLTNAKLAETMWPLPWHVRACWVHSAYAIEGYRTGIFTPDFTEIPEGWDAMRAMVDDATARLNAITADEMEELAGQTIGFELGGKRLMELTGANMLLSVNQPNFFFHATTFYDILRMQGVALGKRDFLGTPRILGS